MAIECFVITFILTAATFSFAHANRIRWVVATIPFAIIPLVNGISDIVCKHFLKTEVPVFFAITAILVSAMISCIWIGIMSGFLNSKRMKLPYITVGFLFNIILGMILINHYMSVSV